MKALKKDEMASVNDVIIIGDDNSRRQHADRQKD